MRLLKKTEMEAILIIGAIIFVIWIIVKLNSSDNDSSSESKSASTTYKPNYDYYTEVLEKLQEEAKKLEREKLFKEKEEKENQIVEEKIKQEKVKNDRLLRIQSIHKQDKINENEKILSNYRVEYFYHMTHKDNLKSILNNGLYSHNLAHSKGLNNQDIANNEVIRIRATKRDPINNLLINDYAPLYINPKNPMLFVHKTIEQDLVIIAFDRSLIYYPHSIFTDGNAANRPTKFYNSINDLNQLNWQCLNAYYWNDFPDGTRIRMSEVLVKEKIPNSKIRKLFCCSSKTLTFVNSLISNYEYIDAEINLKLFFNTYKSESSNEIIRNFDEDYDDLPF